MWFCPGQARAKLAFFSGFCTTCRATNRKGQFLLGFHGLQHAPLPVHKMVNSEQCIDQNADILEPEKS